MPNTITSTANGSLPKEAFEDAFSENACSANPGHQGKMFTERPVTLLANNQHITTFKCTPDHLEELAIGHLVTTGRIHSSRDILDCRVEDGLIMVSLRLQTPPPALSVIFDRHGLPQADSLPHYSGSLDKALVSMQRIKETTQEMISTAVLYQQTGGVHCAAFGNGERLLCREDVGRNNAVDKVIGAALLQDLDRNKGFLLVTARVAFEIFIKVATANIPILASVNIPSDLAVAGAQSAGVTLIGKVLKKEQYTYTHPQRIESSDGCR